MTVLFIYIIIKIYDKRDIYQNPSTILFINKYVFVFFEVPRDKDVWYCLTITDLLTEISMDVECY